MTTLFKPTISFRKGYHLSDTIYKIFNVWLKLLPEKRGEMAFIFRASPPVQMQFELTNQNSAGKAFNSHKHSYLKWHLLVTE